MTSFTQSLTRIGSLIKGRKKNPDWSRVDEPDNILPSFNMFIVGFIVNVFLMMLAYVIMNDTLAVWIGTFLAMQHLPYPFEDQLAAFTAVVILFFNLIVIMFASITREPGGDDVVEMISDLDANTQERIVELEHTIDERLRRIEDEIGVPVLEVPDERLKAA